jgi:xylose isomerase
MKNIKFCVNSGFLGQRRDRFTVYQPVRTLEEKFKLASQIGEIEGIELKYPFDLEDVAFAKKLLDDFGLSCSAVNVDIKDAEFFRFGALSARSKSARDRAVALLQEGMDVAVELGADLVSTCPLADGYDYPFQTDYQTAWNHFIESVRGVATHRPDVKLALEYQPHEPHARILLRNVGMVLHVCAEVNEPNVGANLDIGHSFAALETPAESAVLLAGKNRLFYIHTNDNTGDGGDWDMISGTVHFWHWVELLYVLDQIGYSGWLGGDIAPKHTGAVDAYATNFRMLLRMNKFLDKLGRDTLNRILSEDSDVSKTFDRLSKVLFDGK